MSSLSLVVHDTVSFSRAKKRSSILSFQRNPDAAPIPPSLVNSPYLSSPNSVFRRKSSVLRWPSQREDEWLRDMVPIDRSAAFDVDTKSEGSGPSTPSPTTSENPFSTLTIPPSPMLRPRSAGPVAPTLAKRALSGPGSTHSPHN